MTHRSMPAGLTSESHARVCTTCMTSLIKRNLTARSIRQKASTVFIEGYLEKKGGSKGGFRNWKTRWFVLKEEALYYYKSKDEPVLLGVIPLRGAEVCTPENFQAPPEWTDDSTCRECKSEFTFFNRKHHCRNCGEIFCSQCSSKQAPILQLGFDKPVRVCDKCFEDLSSRRRTSNAAISSAVAALPGSKSFEQSDSSHSSTPASVNSGPLVRNRSIFQTLLGSSGETKHIFYIRTPDRSLQLACPTPQSKFQWIECLNQAITARPADAVAVVPEPHKDEWEIDYNLLTIQEKVGDGAFGEVFKGRLWGTDVAIKKLKLKDVAKQAELLEDLKREIAILSNLRHPNMVLYIGACTKPPNVCIITEWCDRGSLNAALHGVDCILPVRVLLQQAMGIAQGINYLHSLESRIIHRDLKSHNILLDKNFGVKIADFGLSHMRDHVMSNDTSTSSSSATTVSAAANTAGRSANQSRGRFGIFGTPEWMAPEVMDDLPYNEKVDVYSYGIVLCELLSRIHPFSDMFNFTCYQDVAEAVLDDGARPTIPDWCRPLFQEVIDACLNHTPEERPNFTEIILLLREKLALSETYLFVHYDLPRLLEQLESVNPKDQYRAALELSHMCRGSANSDLVDACHQCGSTFGFPAPLCSDDLIPLLLRLTALLSSSDPPVQSASCTALESVLTYAQQHYAPAVCDQLAHVVHDSGGVRSLLLLLTKDFEDHVQRAAAAVLTRFHVESNEIQMLRLSAPQTAALLQRLNALLDTEASRVYLKLEQEQARLQARLTTIAKLHDTLTKVDSAAPPIPLSRPKLSTHRRQVSRVSASIAELFNEPESAAGLEPVAESPTAENLVAVPLDNLPCDIEHGTLKSLPEAFAEFYGDLAQTYGHAMMFNSADEGPAASSRWSPVFLLVCGSELKVFGSLTDDPMFPLLSVQTRDAHHNSINTSAYSDGTKEIQELAAYEGPLRCIDVHDTRRYTHFVFAFVDNDTLERWSQALNCKQTTPVKQSSTFVGKSIKPSASIAAAAVRDTALCSLPHDEGDEGDLVPNPPLQGELGEFFGDVGACGHLLVMTANDNEWRVRFCVLLAKELRCFISADASPYDCESIVYLTTSSGASISVIEIDESAFAVRDGTGAAAIASQTMFCAHSTAVRRRWLQSIQRAVQPVPASPAIVVMAAPVISDSITLSAASIPAVSDDELQIGHHPGLKQPSDAFVKLHGKCYRHGYLWKRGDMFKTWKLRYCYLVQNRLIYFRSHEDAEALSPLGVIWTTTGSGKPFVVARAPADGDRTRVFVIAATSRLWHLSPVENAEMDMWIDAFEAARKQK